MSNNISNPIPAKQVVNVTLDWGCLTQPLCLTLEDSLQAIVGAICDIKNIDGSCLNASTYEETMAALITKVCQTDTTITSTPTVLSYTINGCTADSWVCEQSPCITATTTDPEELIQILYNAVISTRTELNKLCETVANQQNQIDSLQLQLDAGGC